MPSDPGLSPLETESTEANGPKGEPGARLGPYILQRPLGSGGMGTVYLAVNTVDKRTVALKLLPRERASNPALVKRFHQEAAAVQQLQHENIVFIYESGEADGYLYIALEYIDGTDVQQLLKERGTLPLRRSLEIIKQVARALDHAFRQGIVHRDIKPSNMLIKRNGTVKLTDLGLARSVDETLDTGVTREGTTVGTVDYMAPEQAKDSKAADIRSDIYSLGCALYHMLTGSPPFPTGSLTNKLYAHIADPRPDPRKINPDIPEHIVKIIHKMMARKTEDRYQTPADLLEKLEQLTFRGDAVSNRFMTVLSDVVLDAEEEPEVEIIDDHESRSRRRNRSSQSRPRPRRSTARKRGKATDWKPEFGRVLGILLAGLLAFTAMWWFVVSLIPGSGG